MSENLYETWGSDSERDKVIASQNLDGYEGTVYRSEGHGWNRYGSPQYSNQQTYIDIEPNKSVRPSFNRSDYDAFRPGESIPTRQKKIMAACMASYDRVGIIRNVIDLMSDFASQGLVLVHPNKTIEKFYRKWFSQVNGYDRSERFLNYLYRCGNVVVQRRTAKLNRQKEAELKRAAGADVVIDNLKVPRREVPWMYDFVNPVAVDVTDAGMLAVGKPQFHLNISKYTYQSLLNSSNNNSAVFKTLPKDLQNKIIKGERKIPLGDNTFFYHYKKDDWLLWANPMIYAILDDVRMLEKMKLADLAALDGTISQVRLWTVGDFDQKIVPTKAGLEKIRNILASNVGGGTMDLVWGPELKFTESNSQAYKFLGSEKYQPVLTSIYAGLGIPPTLTGASGNNGGYTNNYVSLKTLIERLEYGREVLTRFWKQEIEYVRKAMGFRLPAEIHFDSIILSDESAQKKLLMDLADRDIISQETLLERFREIPNIEKVRVSREERERSNNPNAPKKAGPYHNPHHVEDVAKLGMQKDQLDTEEYFEKLGLPYMEKEEEVKVEEKEESVPVKDTEQEEEIKEAGRPDQSRDTEPRKQRRVLPRSGEPTAAILWGIEAQEKISDMMTPVVCRHYSKKDSRSLSKAQVQELEYLKLSIFTSMEPMIDVTHESIQEALAKNTKPSSEFVKMSEGKAVSFNTIRQRKPNTSEMRHIYASAFAEIFCNWAE
jgi:hypothetical protein